VDELILTSLLIVILRLRILGLDTVTVLDG